MMSKTKKAIFDAAIKIFSINGYEGATMDDMAQEAGVAKGTLYYHFKSKEEIFKYVITEGIEVIKEQIAEVTEKEKNSLSKLKALCRLQLNLVYEKKDFFKVIMSQLWGQEIRQLELREVIGKYINSIEKYIKDAMDEGVIKKGDPYFMAYIFFGLLCSAAVYELINKGRSNIDEVTENLMMYILNGIQV
ncbi:transcriptional regulator, TetR family [Clostridium sp. USBA 49]|nr:transcriptional regulator, TetR family [Clostridium sp. USBA 49]